MKHFKNLYYKPYLYYFVLSFTLIISSCKQDKISLEMGYEYFGLEEGKFVSYEVQEIFHDINLNPASDTNHYILKTLVGEEIIDNAGRKVNKIFRYKFNKNTNELIDQRVWTARIDERRAEMIEENQRKIRLIFSPAVDKKWNVNSFNDLGEKDAYYIGVHEPKGFNGNFFDSTLTVQYDEFFSLVDFIRLEDTYAKHIGLVNRSYKDLTINNFDTLNIQSGIEIYYKLIDFGEE